MNEQSEQGTPEWDLADRMRKSLRHAGIRPREVAPLPAGDHTRIDPFTEIRMVAPQAKVIVVEVPGDTP